MINLTKRQKEILLFLCKKNSYIRIDELAKEFSVSSRSLRNDILQIEAFANEYGCIFQRKNNAGIRIEHKSEILNIIRTQLEIADVCVFSKKDRIYIVTAILMTKNISTFQDLADMCYVSRQTIINDFSNIERIFKEDNILIEKISGVGLLIKGDEVDIRRKMIQLLSDKHQIYIVKHYILQNIRDVKLDEVKRLIKKIEHVLHISFIDQERLLLILAFIIHRIRNGDLLSHFEQGKDSMGAETDKIIKVFKSIVPYQIECNYISTLILSERINQLVLNEQGTDSGKDEAHEIASFLVESLNQLHEQGFRADAQIMQGLTLHLRSAIYRSRNHIRIQNELLDQIKLSISLIFEFTRKQLYKVENMYHLSFDENEVAYIAMYIASIYESNVQQSMNLRVLLVCSFGLATSSILKTRLLSIIPDCIMEGPLSESEAMNFLKENSVDLIIATNEFDFQDRPVISVNPLLVEGDIEKIKTRLFQYSYSKMCSGFIHFYADTTLIEEQKHYLKDYVQHDHIQVVDECDQWEQAIQLAAQPLLEKKLIEPRYVNSMIRAVYHYGTYMVLTPEAAYVHAGIDDGITQNCTSVLVMKKPISFGNKNAKNIRVIVVLGIKNKEDSGLLNLAYIFEKKHNLEILKKQEISIPIIECMHD